MSGGNRTLSAMALALVVAACNAEPESETTSFTTAPEPSSSSATTTTGVDPDTGTPTTGATSTGSTGADTTGEPGDSTGTATTGTNTVECNGVFPSGWPDGSSCGSEFPVYIHQYGPNTVILRESLCATQHGPFMYLLLGQDQALLVDTGANVPEIPVLLTEAVQNVISQWLMANGGDSLPLLVVNTHAHAEHVGYNADFADLPNTTVVGASQALIQDFFKIANWPEDIASYDLGGRQIDIIPIPGHQGMHLAIYDYETGILLTGDTLMPGRLVINDFGSYVPSIQRLVDHTETRDVCDVLGSHIEMTSMPGVEIPFGEMVHPDEHELRLGREHLIELRDAVVAMGPNPVMEVHDDFIIMPL